MLSFSLDSSINWNLFIFATASVELKNIPLHNGLSIGLYRSDALLSTGYQSPLYTGNSVIKSGNLFTLFYTTVQGGDFDLYLKIIAQNFQSSVKTSKSVDFYEQGSYSSTLDFEEYGGYLGVIALPAGPI